MSHEKNTRLKSWCSLGLIIQQFSWVRAMSLPATGLQTSFWTTVMYWGVPTNCSLVDIDLRGHKLKVASEISTTARNFKQDSQDTAITTFHVWGTVGYVSWEWLIWITNQLIPVLVFSVLRNLGPLGWPQMIVCGFPYPHQSRVVSPTKLA